MQEAEGAKEAKEAKAKSKAEAKVHFLSRGFKGRGEAEPLKYLLSPYVLPKAIHMAGNFTFVSLVKGGKDL